jgi:transcriptional regulator with XRE-family HTH domain
MDRNELAGVLRRARERVDAATVGFPSGGRRRVPGLRREEVAALAGISVDYVIRLEQARGPHPTPWVLGALARALRMSDAQRVQLFELADAKLPRAGQVDMLVPASVQRLLDRLHDLPVLVVSAKGDALAWNALGAALLGDWSQLPLRERNLNWQRFLGTRNRIAATPDESRQAKRQAVARLRSASARHPDDREVARLVNDLRKNSEDFDQLWREAPAEVWASHPKTVDHPELGPIVLDCDTLILPDSGQIVMVFSAQPGTPADEQLELLKVIGTQRMTDARDTPSRARSPSSDRSRSSSP